MFTKEKLLKDIQKARDSWDERSCFKLKGVKNLSQSDLDTLEVYAKNDGDSLMRPRGYVKEVLEKYGYEHDGRIGVFYEVCR